MMKRRIVTSAYAMTISLMASGCGHKATSEKTGDPTTAGRTDETSVIRPAPPQVTTSNEMPAEAHDGPRMPWYRVQGPGRAYAMLGTASFGIVAFVSDGEDDRHFLNILYKGNCQQGWEPYYKAHYLGTALASPNEPKREIPTPSFPWITTRIAATCSQNSTTTLTVGEAMMEMMRPQNP
jgi:hypothetical protein